MTAFVDSHCHIDFPELAADLPGLLAAMKQNRVGWALCAGVTLEGLPALLDIVQSAGNLFAAVGVHPDTDIPAVDPNVDQLIELSKSSRLVAIGETGLDYYRLSGDLEWQRQRFRTHIQAARATGKPLIIHTRAAAEDTLKILREEKAGEVGGVFHCFTESREIAAEALDMGFHISFSGIVTFKNAVALKAIAAEIPLNKMLVETDSPYLAPVPYRGKINQPAYVLHVAEEIARLRDISLDTIAEATTANFFRLFKDARP